MLPDLLGLAIAAAVIAVPFVSRRVRAGRVRAAGTAAVSPPRHRAAGGAAAPAVTVHPRATEPFAGDGILIRGESS